MLYLINTYSGGSSQHRCPLAFAAAAPQCRVVNEMVGAGFSTRHYSSQLMQRSKCERVDMDTARLFADETVPRAHVINVTDADDEGNIPASLVASCWWFARRHSQHVPISLLLTGKSCSSLEALRRLDFAHRVEVLYIAEPTTAAGPDYLSPLATFTNVRKVCEFSPCGDVWWMLSCPQLAYVETTGRLRPADWNIAKVLPALPALTELSLNEGGVGSLSWLPRCTSLTRLTLGICPWLENCHVFSTMPELTFLTLVFTRLADISGLVHCHKLNSLDLTGAEKVVDASSIGSLHQLGKLQISHTAITDIGWIKNCGALEEVHLSHMNIVRGFDSLAALRHLRSITLATVPQFRFDWVSSHHTYLEEVLIYGVDTLPGLAHLRNARALQTLTLPNVADVAWLGDCLMLAALTLSCDVGALRAIHSLLSLPHLRDLRLSLRGNSDTNEHNSVAAPFICVDSTTTSPLETLMVEGINMTDMDARRLVECIRHCPTLRSLTLFGVPLQEVDGRWLTGLASLETLDVGFCMASTAALSGVGTLTALKKLALNGVLGWSGFGGTLMCVRLERLEIRSCKDLSNVSGLGLVAPMRDLSHVAVGNVPFTTLSFLVSATVVRDLAILSLPQLTNLADVAACQNLRTLTLSSCPLLTSLDGLQRCTSLTECEISSCSGLVNADALSACAALTDVTLRHLPALPQLCLTGAARLETVLIADCAALTSLTMPRPAAALCRFTMEMCVALRSLPSFSQCGRLKVLSLTHNTQLETMPTLTGCKRVSAVFLNMLTCLRDLSELLAVQDSLCSVQLWGCASVANFAILSKLPHLKSLDLSSVALPDVSWIGQCTALTHLRLTGCTGSTDYSAIAMLTELKNVHIRGCPLQDIRWASQMTSPPVETFDISDCHNLEVTDGDLLPPFVQRH